jgi:GrpB-like predicted nucleotidyltransferase (UPF0157 family)
MVRNFAANRNCATSIELTRRFRRSEDGRLRAAPGAYIHHIGSTAVQGLVAKDIIDIQLTVDDLEKAPLLNEELWTQFGGA